MKTLAFLLLTFLPMTVSAGINENSGLNGYDFLALGAGAQPNALAGAYTGASGDLYSLYWNPAGVSSVTRTSFMADYMKYVLDMHRGLLGFTLDPKRVHGLGTLGGYINYFYGGKFEAVDEEGNRVDAGDFTAGYTEFCATYARILPSFSPGYSLSAGITAKGVLERIENYRTYAMGTDLGVHCIFPSNRLKIGAVVKNLGTIFGEGGEEMALPQIYAVGLQFFAQSQTRFMLDLNKPRYGDYTVRLGMEYRVNRDFCIRGGYRFLQDEVTHWYHVLRSIKEYDYAREDFNTWSAGIGLKLNKNVILDISAAGTQFQTFPLITSSLLYTLK